MSILCDFCGEKASSGYLTSYTNGDIHICTNCVHIGSEIISERKNNSEAPTAGTGEASDLSGTKE
nr:hypothetical protein [Providencia rettgeri]ELR5197713.1 hypothetical protein [Providencia rettgeri]